MTRRQSDVTAWLKKQPAANDNSGGCSFDRRVVDTPIADIVCFVAMAMMLALACAQTAGNTVRESAIAAAKIEKDTIRAFLAWDSRHQQEIATKYKTAGDVAGGEKALAVYRGQRAEIVATLKLLGKTLNAIPKFADLVDLGMAGDPNTYHYIADMMGLMQKLAGLFDAVGFKLGDAS